MSYDFTRYVEVGECHEWTGRYDTGKRTSGPIIKTRANGKAVNLTVPRLVWLAAGRVIPDGQVVYRHVCCNSKCIRLEHLRCAPRGVHLQRRAELGMAVHMQSTRANLTKAARKRAATKYTAAQAAVVRQLAADGLPDADISAQTGVGAAMVADIRRGKAWKPSVGAASVFEWRPSA